MSNVVLFAGVYQQITAQYLRKCVVFSKCSRVSDSDRKQVDKTQRTLVTPVKTLDVDLVEFIR